MEKKPIWVTDGIVGLDTWVWWLNPKSPQRVQVRSHLENILKYPHCYQQAHPTTLPLKSGNIDTMPQCLPGKHKYKVQLERTFTRYEVVSIIVPADDEASATEIAQIRVEHGAGTVEDVTTFTDVGPQALSIDTFCVLQDATLPDDKYNQIAE